MSKQKQIQQRCIATLKHHPKGLTSDGLLAIFSEEDGTPLGFGGLPKYLSNLLKDGAVCATGKGDESQRIYIHLDYKDNYNPMDLLRVPKKFDKRDHCLNLFEQAYLENDKHKFELALRSLEDIRNG